MEINLIKKLVKKKIYIEKPLIQKSITDEDFTLKFISKYKFKIPLISKSEDTIKKSLTIQKNIDDISDSKTRSRITTKPTDEIYKGPIDEIKFSEIIDELPKNQNKFIIKAPKYYLNNRQIFINFISSLFYPYKKEIDLNKDLYSCDKKESNDFDLLIHQKIVRDYINIFTPYRGILLYHGLGSGKTCSSIAITEAFKSDKQIFIMTPASLRRNYIEELKKCGDLLYRKNQNWQFINIEENPELLEPLSYALKLKIDFIKKNKGAWLVNLKIKESNYDKLSSQKQLSLDNQIVEMIKYKYQFINYNGLRNTHIDILTKNNTINPFDNCVIVIDEAHNFISRIVNKIEHDNMDKPKFLITKLYNYLMIANNCRIILLTGTPIINYPNEIAIMMNILRGKIKVWEFKLLIKDETKVRKDFLINLFKSNSETNNIFDLLEYNETTNLLKITRNPFAFYSYNKVSNINEGVYYDNTVVFDDNEFKERIKNILSKNNIDIINDEKDKPFIVTTHNCLPDTQENFNNYFIDLDSKKKMVAVKNMNLFKKRILGLTSYFPDIEELLPNYKKEKDFKIKYIEMSDTQFAVYEAARIEERKLEMRNVKKRKLGELYENSVSTYRIFSRSFCNFVFPNEFIQRPMPKNNLEMKSIVEELENQELCKDYDDELDDDSKVKELQLLQDVVSEFSEFGNTKDATKDGIKDTKKDNKKSYNEKIKIAFNELKENKEKFLSKDSLKELSPKFLNIIENINDLSYTGLHLMYSQFRTLEGIGIFSLVLEANGYAEFKIKKDPDWKLDISIEDMGKPKYVLYTGTEDPEFKEIYRNIFNGDWDLIPPTLKNELERISSNNLYGEIIKLIMITSSGAEGISLKNVRFVHITDPYWHPVRIKQIIGRARRICSHKNLPKELQNVKVFLYLMKLTEKQIASSIELKLKDISKIDSKKVLTTDEAIYEIANLKENINNEILKNLKESAIDCNIHNSGKDNINCFTFGTSVTSDKLSYNLSIFDDQTDKISDGNKEKKSIKLLKASIPEVGDVVYDKSTGNVFTLESYNKKSLFKIGKLNTKINPDTGKEEYEFEELKQI